MGELIAADRAEIVECWSRYCRLMDERRQADFFEHVYADDGVLEQRLTPSSSPAVFTGRDEIVAMLVASWQLWRGTAHVLGNTEVAATPQGAHGCAYVSAWHWLADTPLDSAADWMCVGRIDDDFVRTTRGWRVARRRLTSVGGPVAVGRMPGAMAEQRLDAFVR